MKRILTAAVLISLLLGTLWLPPVAFVAFIALVALLGWNEYSRMAASLDSGPASAPGGLLAMLLAISFSSSDPAAVPVVLILAVFSSRYACGARMVAVQPHSVCTTFVSS